MVFKSIDPSDISISRFKVFKNWSCDETTVDSLGIVIQDGVSGSGTFNSGSDAKNTDGTFKRLIWASINHLYYPFSSSLQASKQTTRDKNNYYQNFIDMDKLPYISRSEDRSPTIKVINIPERIFGEKIKPGTVYLVSSSITVIDDENYNMFISGSDPRSLVGNVFYHQGQLVFTSQSFSASLDAFDLEFKSVHEIKEYEVACTVLESEFNYPTNPSAQDPDGYHYIPMFSSSEEKPSITMIGLYNDKNECMMVGKLPRPYKRMYDLDTTFILRVDL